jgi:hypothetical protein
MRISREKIVRISHKAMDVLVASDEVEFVDDRDTIRQKIVLILTETLREEEKAEAEVRKRITLLKRRKSWKAARSGTFSTASITRKNFAAWASRLLWRSTTSTAATNFPGYLPVFTNTKSKRAATRPPS